MADPLTNLPPVVSVSPGEIEGPTWLADPCPTFSWGSVPEAAGYDLAIFWASHGNAPTHERQTAQGEPVLEIRIAAPALSWTPDTESCLDDDTGYVWFVRAFYDTGIGPWSLGRQFEVDLGEETLADELKQAVREQLAEPSTLTQVCEALSIDLALALGLLTPGPPVWETETGRPTMAVDPGAAGVAPEVVAYPNPSAFSVNGPNGVVFRDPADPTSGGPIPQEGAGTRFMWYPGKSALRAGYVWYDQWDDVNIGNYSVAMGDTTTASGVGSTAMGVKNTASGGASTAMGESSLARSFGETALGLYNTDYLPNSTTEWDADDRLLVIGNGQHGARSDAMVIWKNGDMKLYGRLRVGDWAAATNTGVCRNGDTLAICSSSRRHKEAIEPLALGLAAVDRLRPVRFKWREREEYDLGFVAEDVAEVDALLTTFGEDGEIEGVKYRQLTAVLVNAVKEQQAQFDQTQEQLEEQQKQIAALKSLVCADHPEAALCP